MTGIAVAAHPRTGRVRPIWVSLSILLVYTASNAPAPLYVVWQREMNFAPSTVSLIFVSYLVGAVLSLLVSGRASDRFGRRSVLLPALILAVVGCVLFAVARSPLWLEGARFLIGLASGSFGAAGGAAIFDAFGPGNVKKAALYASTPVTFGSAVGPLLAGILADHAPAPTSAIFLILVVPMLLMGIPLSATSSVGTADADGGLLRLPRFPRSVAAGVGLAMAVMAGPFALAGLFLSLGSVLLSDVLGIDSRTVAGVVAFVVFGSGGGVQVLFQRVRTFWVGLIGLGAAAAGAVSIALALHLSSIAALVAAAVAAGVGQSLTQLAGLTIARAHAPVGQTAEVTAAVWLAGYATVGSGILALGFLADGMGLERAGYVFCAFFLSVVSVVAVCLVRMRSQASATEH